MALKTEGWLVSAGEALQRAVEQADVRWAQIGRKRFFVHRKAVVLTSDADAVVVEVFDRVVRAVMPELHFESLGTAGQRHDLVTQTNTEGRNAGFDQLAYRFDGVITRLRIARPVGQENPVGFELQGLRRRGLGRYHRDAGTARCHHAKNVFLHAVVEGHDVKLRRNLHAVTRPAFKIHQPPLGFGPFVAVSCRNDFCEVQSRHARRGARAGNCRFDRLRRNRLAGCKSEDAAVLRALRAQLARKLPGVDVGNRHRAFANQVVRQVHAGAEV